VVEVMFYINDITVYQINEYGYTGSADISLSCTKSLPCGMKLHKNLKNE
jgi:hypothetical protein